MMARLIPCILFSLVATLALHADEYPWKDLNPARVQEIEQMLNPAPQGMGAPISNREAWGKIAQDKVAKRIIQNAEKLIGKPFPEWRDEDYLEYSKNGKRAKGEKMMRSRYGRLPTLVWAECIEDKGRFLEEIARVLHERIAEPTWTLPAHDGNLNNFYGKNFTIDLASSAMAYNLGQTLWMLGDRLDPTVRAETIAILEQRIFEPFRSSLRHEKKHWWMTGTNNWNPVCLAGTIGAALAVLPDQSERAVFAAAGEFYSQNFLKGFTEDGYCSEGVGYWNYGVSRYVWLREHLWQATHGNLDLFLDKRVRAAILFGVRIEIIDKVYPAIADCRPGSEASQDILHYCALALDLGLDAAQKKYPLDTSLNFTDTMIWHFPSSISNKSSAEHGERLGLRSWFDKAEVLVSRPASDASVRLGAVFKGGNNAEHHNHNDVGSFTIALDGKVMAGDPGGPYVYNSKTFSGARYTAFKLFSSVSHPVPRVDGQVQPVGRKARAEVLQTSFTSSADILELDLRPAYSSVEGLTQLTRSFSLTRGDQPSVVIRDLFAAEREISFDSVITTRAKWEKRSPSELVFTLDGTVMHAQIDSGGQPIEIHSETVEEDCIPFDVITLRLLHPAAKGSIAVRFIPGPR